MRDMRVHKKDLNEKQCVKLQIEHQVDNTVVCWFINSLFAIWFNNRSVCKFFTSDGKLCTVGNMTMTSIPPQTQM